MCIRDRLGQSVWYDNVSREVLTNGELQALIDAGVSGLTSNPTIFKKAIADTDFYDKELEELGKQGLTADEICEIVMIKDLSMVAAMLRPVYDATGGADGYGSIEVSPLLAEKTAQTVAAAARIWPTLDEPTVMIKIPGTKTTTTAWMAITRVRWHPLVGVLMKIMATMERSTNDRTKTI